jgi:hypothetical protein
MLTTLQADNVAFEQTLDTIHDAQITREKKTEQRITEFNTLFDLITKYCHIGKLIWENADPVLYADYELYAGGATGLPGKLQGLVFHLDLNVATWTEQSSITSYNLQWGVNGVDWSDFYNDVLPEAFFSLQEGAFKFRGRAINANGPGAWSDIMEVIGALSTPTLNDPSYEGGAHRVSLTWSESSTHAPTYEVWRSIVAAGLPAGTFTKAADASATNWDYAPATSNTREYYYILAKSGSLLSGRSNVKAVDVP